MASSEILCASEGECLHPRRRPSHRAITEGAIPSVDSSIVMVAVPVLNVGQSVRGLLSAKVRNSLFAEARRVLLPEPTHMEDEDEDQEKGKEDERDGEECKVESRRKIRTNTAHEAWMT